MTLQQYIGKPYIGDALTFTRQLPDESVHCVITSPPYYGLRKYLADGHPDAAKEMGLEDTPAAYVARLVELFSEVWRVLRPDGTFWLNLGDSWAADRGGTSMPAQTVAGGIGGKGDEDAYRGVGNGYQSHRNAKAIGLKHKDLLMIPARIAIALQDDGWYLRDEIIWHKPNPMPASVKDRTTRAHEMVYLLAKSQKYWYDAAAIAEPSKEVSIERLLRGRSDHSKHLNGAPGQPPHALNTPRPNVRKGGGGFSKAYANAQPEHGGESERRLYETANKRSVWTVPTAQTPEAHFATYPTELIKPMILAGCPPGGIVYDPFLGSGTTAVVAEVLGRQWIGSELNPDYLPIILKRLEKQGGALEWLPLFAGFK